MLLFDITTVFMFTTIIVLSISIATLIFSLARRENRPFLWAAGADFFFAASFVITGFDKVFPSTLGIPFSFVLSIVGMVGYYELYCQLIGLYPKSRRSLLMSLIMLIIAGAVIIFLHPSLLIRIVISDIILALISVFVIYLIISNAPKPLLAVYILISCPFVNIILIAITRIVFLLLEKILGPLTAVVHVYQFLDLSYFLSIIYISIASIFLISSKLHYTLLEYSQKDPLTKVYNRSAFSELFERELALAMRYNDPLNFLICDIDFFKKVNDTYGHLAGDAVIVHVVELLRTSIRVTDLLARYGGEEFAIVLPRTKNINALILAERLRKKVEKSSVEYEGNTISVTCSFGVSYLKDQSEAYEDIIKRADDALYQAKGNGRNRVESN